MKVFTRYLLLQLPGFAVVVVAMILLNALLGMAWWIGALALVFWVAKDLVLYPLLKPAYERTDHLTAHARMIGEQGVAEQELDPSGYVRLRGELWQAEAEGDATIPLGSAVVVCAVDGLKLLVRQGPGSG